MQKHHRLAEIVYCKVKPVMSVGEKEPTGHGGRGYDKGADR